MVSPLIYILAKNDFNLVNTAFGNRDDIAVNSLSIDSH